MGFFGTIFKAVARGVKSVGGKAFKGLKSAGEAVKRGFKSGVEQIKKGVSKIKNTFTKSKQKKTMERRRSSQICRCRWRKSHGV